MTSIILHDNIFIYHINIYDTKGGNIYTFESTTYFLTLLSNQIVHNLYWGPIHPGLPFSTHFFLVDKRAVSIFELINFMFWCFLFSERDGRKVIYICYLYRHLDQIWKSFHHDANTYHVTWKWPYNHHIRLYLERQHI